MKSVVVAVVASVAVAVPAIAWSAGGTTVAGAPTVRYHVQQFGNTSDGVPNNDDDRRVFWRLPVIAGDKVTINWEVGDGADVDMYVCPVGTNDYNLLNVDCDYWGVGSTRKGQASWSAPKTGDEILDFKTEGYTDPGPFDFTAYVHHKAVLSMTRPGSHLAGRVTVSARTPDGNPVRSSVRLLVQAKLPQGWTTLTSAVTRTGSTRLPYRLPSSMAGKKVAFRAGILSGAYLKTTSQIVRVPVS